MIIDEQHDGEPIRIEGESLETVTRFDYLGSSVTTKGSCLDEVKKRVAMGRNAFQKASVYLLDRDVPLPLKVRLLHALVFSVIMYGCEAWTLQEDLKRRLRSVEMWCYRRMLRILWKDHVTNEAVYQKIGIREPIILQLILRRKLSYFGHVCRHPGLEQNIMLGTVEGRRRRGRPPTRWIDEIATRCGGVGAAIDWPRIARRGDVSHGPRRPAMANPTPSSSSGYR